MCFVRKWQPDTLDWYLLHSVRFFQSCRACRARAFSHFLPTKDCFALRSAVLWHGLATGSLLNPLHTQDLPAARDASSIIYEPQIWLDCSSQISSKKVIPPGTPRLNLGCWDFIVSHTWSGACKLCFCLDFQSPSHVWKSWVSLPKFTIPG